MIKLSNINLSYHKVIFEDMNLEISTPGIYGIIGESGIGKTSILNILYGLELSYTGSYYFGDTDVSNSTKIQKYYNSEIALIHQDYKLINKLKAIDNIRLGQITRDDDLIYELAVTLNISRDILNKKVKYLSGGEKQRIAILRGIINNPKVLLLDEPTSGLDSVNRASFIEMLNTLVTQGMIVIIVSHDFVLRTNLENVYEISNKKILLTKGSSEFSENVVVEKQGNKKLSSFTLKNLLSSKVIASLFILISTVFVLAFMFMVTPISSLVEEYNLYVDNAFEEADIIVNNSNTGYTEAEIEAISNIDGVEGVTYHMPMYGNLYIEDVNEVTMEQISPNNSTGMYTIDTPKMMSKYYLQEPINMEFKVNTINDSYDQVIYSEGKSPSNESEVAISSTFAEILMVENNLNTVIDFVLPLTCTDMSGKTYSCDKTITGVVDEYQFENPRGTGYYNGEAYIEYLYVYEDPNVGFSENPAGIAPTYAELYVTVEEGADINAISNEIVKMDENSDVENETTYRESSPYTNQVKNLIKKLLIFYVMGVLFIFAATIAYLITKRRDFAIYLSLGYSKKQILMSSIGEMVILYGISFVLATIVYLLIPLPHHMNFIAILLCGIIFISFYLLAILYLVLGLSKKNIAKNLK